jgi:histidinol-phosphate aminotransferase
MTPYGRTLLKDVEGYTPGEQPKGAGIIKLNTNENPYPPAPQVLEAIRNMGDNALRKYPDPTADALRNACAERYGVPGADWIVIGNGMDELLAMVLRGFVDPGDDVIAVYPTYTLYEVLCRLHGCTLRYVELNDDLLPPDSFYTEQARLCFLTRPNAPTGVSIPRADVERFCSNFKGIVVIDEAYVDFSDDNCMDFPARFDNVIVMRTFSKSFSMAGVRIGTAVAQPALINEFMKIKDSYNMNAFSQTAGLAAMQVYDYMLEQKEKVRATRARLRKTLQEMGFNVPDSQANFLLARWNGTPNAATIFAELRKHNILVRYFAQPRLDNALRITIGTENETDALIAALRDILGAR